MGRVRVLAAAVLLVVLTACSGDETAGSAGSRDLPSEEGLARYFDAVASYDPARLRDAQEVAADGSPAQRYAAYLAEFAAAADAGGQPVPAAEAEAVDGGFEACGGSGAPDECVTWADLEGEDGELTGFTVGGVALEDSLVHLTGQAPIETPGLYTVQPTWAHLSPPGHEGGGSLFVLASVTASDVPLQVGPGTYIEQDVILDTVVSRGPTSIAAGATAPVILEFPDAGVTSLDGQVTFGLRVGPAEESVGFGLTASG
jgi:hypothetical protein